MQGINDIKSLLGQYEKIMSDRDIIENISINNELKEKIYQELQSTLSELKCKIQIIVKKLPEIATIKSDKEENEELLICERIVDEQKNADYKLWKDDISEKIRFIYDRNLKYVYGKEIFSEIYEKMTNVYGIVWEQDFKEWRRVNVGIPRTLDIIYNNEQYKSIFNSILDGLYTDVIESPKVTVKEIIQPLIDLCEDNSKGCGVTLKKIYQYMEERYNIKWQKMINRYEKETGTYLKFKSDLLYWNHGLIERFRQSVSDMIQDMKKN